MKYLLNFRNGSKVEVGFLEDFNGDITDEITINLIVNSFDLQNGEASTYLSEKDLRDFIGILLQAQQRVRNRNNLNKGF